MEGSSGAESLRTDADALPLFCFGAAEGAAGEIFFGLIA